MTFDIGGLSIVLDGKYRLDDRLGEGAAGVVYRATHLRLKRVCALKLLKPVKPGTALEPSSVSRFQREAEALGRLRHPHIVDVTDSGIDPGTGAPYLVMELLDGVPLAELCRTAGPLPLERALPILDAIAAAADAAHEQGILHRDLKPGNVLLCGGDGEAPAVKVLDFGLAEIAGAPLPAPGPPSGAEADGRLTATGDLLGTPLYVAPEVIRGAGAGRASDLYSFGVFAYEMLAGRPPFEGTTREVLTRHLEGEPPQGALSGPIWSVLRDCLAKDPDLRPATAGGGARRLRAAAGRERRARWLRAAAPRRALLAVLLAAAVPIAALLLPTSLPAVERWTYDLRVRAAPALAPDPRILLVTLDSRSTPLPDRADEISGTLERIFAAGARGVALDVIFLNEQWSKSQAFSDLLLRHPEKLTLAALSNPDKSVDGPQSVAPLTAAALGPEKTTSLFGFVNLDEGSDFVVRHGRIHFRDSKGNMRPSFAARAAKALGPLRVPDQKDFWIDYRIAPAGFDRISLRDVPGALAEKPWIFRDRLVLVGDDAAKDDLHHVPRREKRVSGLVLQALQVATLAAGMPVREAPRAPFLALAALWTGLAAAAVLLLRRPAPALAVLLGGLLLYSALSFPAFQRTGLLWPVTPVLLPSLIALALAVILRRALSPIPRNEEA